MEIDLEMEMVWKWSAFGKPLWIEYWICCCCVVVFPPATIHRRKASRPCSRLAVTHRAAA